MKISQKTATKFVLGISLLFSFFSVKVLAIVKLNKLEKGSTADSSLSVEIKRQLADDNLNLYYPNSVKRFYRAAKFISPWNKEQSDDGIAWQAMMFIDCVLQYGLCHDDYHPRELTYSDLHDILQKPGEVPIKKQARFDIMLTDAILNIINNLHFGKLNPDFPRVKIDNYLPGFRAEQTLTKALTNAGFKKTICDSQPKSKEYVDMQYHMYLWKGLYTGDCYEIPESKIRKLAINMERLRWAGTDTGTRIEINIPSYTLKFLAKDSGYSFRVIVGKPESPTPALQSHITYFTTASNPKISSKIFRNELLPKALADSNHLENKHYILYNKSVGCIQSSTYNLSLVKQFPEKYYATKSPVGDNTLSKIVFSFPNASDISLGGTLDKQLFKKEERDLSNGCIRLENAEKLATLILKYDNSANKIAALHNAVTRSYTLNFVLNKPVMLKITYVTCTTKNGEVIDYKDVYNLDKKLEMAFYNTTQAIAVR